MRCTKCIHYDVCSYHIDEETTELTVNECSHGFKHRDQYVRLPAFVGQPVWLIKSRHNWKNGCPEVIGYVIDKGRVSMLQQKADKSWKFRVTINSSVCDYTIEDIGTYVFFSEEAAIVEKEQRTLELEKH